MLFCPKLSNFFSTFFFEKMILTNPFLKPLNTQRYLKAISFIKKENPNLIIDFGCNECNFIYYFTRNPTNINFIIGLDKDLTILKEFKSRL